ncbi:MAG: hypothetical protein ACRC75_11895 [Olsenella sp.]
MAQGGMFGRRRGGGGQQVPPTKSRGDTKDAPGKKRVNTSSGAPVRRHAADRQVPADSAYAEHYGTVTPRDELSLSYSARRRQIVRRQTKKMLIIVGIAVAVLVVVLLVMRVLA